METQITESIELAIELLKRGEVVAFPTETVYGLGASIEKPDAVQRIFSIKRRPLDNPLIVHVFSLDQALSLVDSPPPEFFRLVECFWPGPLALIVKKNISVSAVVSAGHSTVAIRMPKHPIARKILEGVGEPLAAPSANLSGRPSPTTASDVLEDLEGKIPLIVDGGPCSIGIESTVLSLVHSIPTILRPGQITGRELEEVLKCKIDVCQGGPLLSPGMKYRHYAPKAAVRLVFDEEQLKGSFTLSRVPVAGKTTHPLSSQTLYHSLREADRQGVAEIEIYCDPGVQSDAALMNRLTRAANVESVEQPF